MFRCQPLRRCQGMCVCASRNAEVSSMSVPVQIPVNEAATLSEVSCASFPCVGPPGRRGGGDPSAASARSSGGGDAGARARRAEQSRTPIVSICAFRSCRAASLGSLPSSALAPALPWLSSVQRSHLQKWRGGGLDLLFARAPSYAPVCESEASFIFQRGFFGLILTICRCTLPSHLGISTGGPKSAWLR